MKKYIAVLLMVVFAGVFLWGCNSGKKEYIYGYENKSYTVNTEDKTIYDGRFTYTYEIKENADSDTLTITYPNGSTWWIRYANGKDGFAIIGRGNSSDYIDERYSSGEILYDAYTSGLNEGEDGLIKITPVKVIVGAIPIALGVFMIIAPHKMWRIYEGWKFEGEMEPSDTYIGVTVASGIFIIIASVGLILFM